MLQLALTVFLAVGIAALALKLCLFEYDDGRVLLMDAVMLLIGISGLYLVVTQ